MERERMFGASILPCGDVSRLLELDEFDTLRIPLPTEEVGMKEGDSPELGVDNFRIPLAPPKKFEDSTCAYGDV